MKPPKPGVAGTGLKGSANQIPFPVKPDPRTATKKFILRRRSGPVEDRAYLRVSGPLGPLTGVYPRPEAMPLKATNQIVTTPGIKATLFRASGPGRRGFAAGLMCRECGASRLPLFLPRGFSRGAISVFFDYVRGVSDRRGVLL